MSFRIKVIHDDDSEADYDVKEIKVDTPFEVTTDVGQVIIREVKR